MKYRLLTISSAISLAMAAFAQQPANVPPRNELSAVFGEKDRVNFANPPKVYYPETWFHYIEGNVDKRGITADLEAIAASGISGIHLFHGSGNAWPGVKEQILSLSSKWDDAVTHTAREAQRLGLRFTMQNCPGWAMSGGPWIKPSNAMRHLVWSRTDINSGDESIMLPVPDGTAEEWRDYKDLFVLAFPTPVGDENKPLSPVEIKSDLPDKPWLDCVSSYAGVDLPPVSADKSHWIELTFDEPKTVRSIEFSSINGFYHDWCFEPGVSFLVQALPDDGSDAVDILSADMPQSNWQDDKPITFACREVAPAKRYRVAIDNRHPMHLGFLHLYSAARKNNWEAEAGWTLRSQMPELNMPEQSADAFINYNSVLDLTSRMGADGKLDWSAPDGKWTVLRVGHVNTGMRNGPAPQEATGWECDKLSTSGADAHFAGYIGRLADGPLKGGLLGGMLLDSWECRTQTWTDDMEAEFRRVSGYDLRQWVPALFGYVMNDPETTSRFLRDWRSVLNDLVVNKFYGRMARQAKEKGLTITYETAAGDVFPTDIMEYFKYADVPMCEFWQHSTNTFVGSINFKPVKPTVSAARLYGKPRVSAEAFTSFQLTWDEHLGMLKENANFHAIEGVTHHVFHTYTHNPCADTMFPGTSFGQGIGTPFLRGQTWWRHMPAFTTYLARCTYLLERGRPVSDVLWYLGDEIDHKPNQQAPFPAGYKYDYCNPDVLLNRLSVRDGMIVTPEGISYRLLWIPENHRMLPQTLERLVDLVNAGAIVLGNAPENPATLSSPEETGRRFNAAVHTLWGSGEPGVRNIGKGKVIAGHSIDEALGILDLQPDVTGDALWIHRKADGADWYYVCAPEGSGFKGEMSFRNTEKAEIWDPLTGEAFSVKTLLKDGRTFIDFDLPRAGSCFVVFGSEGRKTKSMPSDYTTVWTADNSVWTLDYPLGWGQDTPLQISALKAWKDLDVSDEAKAFSGTVKYKTDFKLAKKEKNARYILDLGEVDMIAEVSMNGQKLSTVWTSPYVVDITDAVRKGRNELTVDVTGTWFNRLVYDAGLPEADRKTWTISGPAAGAPLRNSGLIGPVKISIAR